MSELKKLITQDVGEANKPKKNGGYRPGSGRKKKLVKYGSQNDAFVAAVVEHWDELVASLMRLANGCTYEGLDKKGEVVVYTDKPDKGALEYLFNRVLGKPKEMVEHSGDIKLSIDV